ncbi:MAG TPA: excalibur calcium-binding domain-containing protein [Kribbella sp.]|nr:excalibur calcium-binding domain-containing protein [Kribbella sp.]
MLKLGLAAAVVVALAGTWLFVPFGRPDAASTQTPESSSVPTAERTQGTTRSNPRPSLPVGKPLSTPSLLPPAATVTPAAPTWAAPPGATGTSASATSTPGSPATDPTTGNPSTTSPTTSPTTGSTTTGGTTTPPSTANPTTAGPTTAGPTTAGPTTGSPTTSSPTTSSSSPGTPTASPSSTPTYKNCAEVRAAGKAPLYRGDPGYTPELDRNGDGVACERGSS